MSVSNETPSKRKSSSDKSVKDVEKAAKKAAKLASKEDKKMKKEVSKSDGGNETSAKVDSDHKTGHSERETMTDGSEVRKGPSLEEKISKQESDPNLLEVDISLPEPLSKAQARLAKKNAKRTGPDGEDQDESAQPAKKQKTTENAKPKRANSIWIGNLSYKTTADELKSWFAKELGLMLNKNATETSAPTATTATTTEGGEESKPARDLITRVNLPLDRGRSRFGAQSMGFAFVDFAHPSLQRKAMKLSEKLLDGRKVLIKMGDDYQPAADARTPKPLLSIKAGAIPKKMPHAESTSIFVGNLDFKSTEEELFTLIEDNFKAARAPSAPKRGKKVKAESGSESDSDEDDQEEDKAEEEEEEEEKDEMEVDEPAGDDEEKDEGDTPDQTDVTKVNKGKPVTKAVSGLKKVRMPLFEDSGRCKGFAFLDFIDKDHAKICLANRANHYLRGRKLVLQYASQDATKRSMSAARRSQLDRPEGEQAAGGTGASASAGSGPRFRAGAGGDANAPAKSRGTNDSRQKWEQKGRAAPGAALAMAKRQNVAIVEGGAAGKKITFD